MLKFSAKRRRTKEEIEADNNELEKKRRLEEDQANEIEELRRQIDLQKQDINDAEQKQQQYHQFFKNGILSLNDLGNVEVVHDL